MEAIKYVRPDIEKQRERYTADQITRNFMLPIVFVLYDFSIANTTTMMTHTHTFTHHTHREE